MRTEGAGNAGCAVHPRPRVQKKAHALATTGTPHQPAFPARWFYGLYRALPGDRALLPPSFADYSTTLTPASGRQDHTILPSALAPLVQRRYRVHRIPPHVRDDREAPSCRGGTAGREHSFRFSESKIFVRGELTTQISLNRFTKLEFRRMRFFVPRSVSRETTSGKIELSRPTTGKSLS